MEYMAESYTDHAVFWEDSIFAPDVACSFYRESYGSLTITPSFARLADIVEETYACMVPDMPDIHLDLTKEMLMYYTTVLLWQRLLNIKNRNHKTTLTKTEHDFLNSLSREEFYVPWPIYLILKAVGNVTKSGRVIFLADHSLPVAVVDGLGGYHAATVDAESHNLFEEIPCLGVVADTLMPLCAVDNQAAVPDIKPVPAELLPTTAMCGYFRQSGVRNDRVVDKLKAFGITADTFSENIPTTRLNHGLVDAVNKYLRKVYTFDKIVYCSNSLPMEGDKTQLIILEPTTETIDPNAKNAKWTQLVAQPYTSCLEEKATLGASYFTGFQLIKSSVGFGQHANWCCVSGPAPWHVPDSWIANRNARRVMPDDCNFRLYRGISDSLENRTKAAITRMIKTKSY